MRAKEFITEHSLVWKRNPKTGQVSLKWRCESGPRKGRVVPSVNDCSASLDVAQAQVMKRTRQKTKIRQARKAKRTKKVNPSSRLIQRLNKAVRQRTSKK
jgi:hypothetical protein